MLQRAGAVVGEEVVVVVMREMVEWLPETKRVMVMSRKLAAAMEICLRVTAAVR